MEYFAHYSFVLYLMIFSNRFVLEYLVFIRVFDFYKHSITFGNKPVADFTVLTFFASNLDSARLAQS